MQEAPYRLVPVHSREGISAYAKVSPEDYARINAVKWNMKNDGYPARNTPRNRGVGPRPKILMHREVLGLKHLDGKEVDHMNHDKLDNRRSNLRIVSHAQNCQNTSSRKVSTSRYRGVSWANRERRWVARATFEGKPNCLGYFVTEEDAGAAVNDFWVRHGHPAPNALGAVAKAA